MKAKLGTVIVTLAIATGVMVSTAAPALASQCGGKTIASLRRCINTRVAAQHNQIVKLQAKVKSLSLTVTTQALALRVKNLTTTVHNQGNTLSGVTTRTNCWSDSLALSEIHHRRQPMGKPIRRRRYPYPGPSNYSYMDLMQGSQPANQNVWHVLVNYC